MRLRYLYFFIIFFGSFSIIAQDYSKIGNHDFNFDWNFKLDKIPISVDEVQQNQWSDVVLPHDWGVHFPFDSKLGEGATAYLPGGIGMYKKDFSLDNTDATTYILFDGVYNNSTIHLNDKLLGFHPYGYSPFYFDISEYLKNEGGTNTITVKVDHSNYVDSRWYSGSGIYRNVKLVRKHQLHVPIWGIFITTPTITQNNAIANIKTDIKNNSKSDADFDLRIQIYDYQDKLVSDATKQYTIKSKESIKLDSDVDIANPLFWSIESPKMYKAVVSLLKEGTIIDTNEVPFGIRKIKFDVDKGFFLNDVNVAIKGVCLHHDGGLVGAAVPKDVWRRRLQKLRDAGCNAVRISHNPASDEFLDLCDEMGFLVQDEFFDEWDNPKDKRLNQNDQIVDSISRGHSRYFQKWAEKDLKSTMLAHRNHPSIFQWSIGNEIEWTYPRNQKATGFFDNMSWTGNYFWEEPPYTTDQIKKKLETLPKGKYDIGETAKKLADWTREMDTTRYVTANCILPSASHLSGYADVLDVIGYSYRRVLYDYGHKNYPDIPIMGTENLAQWHEWKAVQERPFISGTFLWTGIDYMGESHKKWPRKATPSGMLDIAGFEKPSYHMMKTLWNEEPHIYIATQKIDKSIFKKDESTGEPVERKKDAWKYALWFWHDVNEHWNYEDKESVVVEVYSNCDTLELCLNGESLGLKKLENFEDRIYKWIVPFAKGDLKVVGYKDGEVEQIETISTTEKVEKINITTDRVTLKADGYSVAHIIAQLEDTKGNPVKNIEQEISFNIEGDVTILGVDNGSASNTQDFKSNKIITDKGRCMLLIQSKKNPSEISIQAKSKEINSNKLHIVAN